MDALIAAILSSPLAFVIVILVIVFLLFIGKVYVYPELVDKKVLEKAHKELFSKYQALLEKESERAVSIEELLTDGPLKDLERILASLHTLGNTETLENIDRNVSTLLVTQKELLREVLDRLKQLERIIEEVKSSGDSKSDEALRKLEAVSRDCTDIIRRHDVITGALLQRLTGESSPVALKGLQ